MKHAYLILAHNNYYCLEKLLRLIDDARNDIYIHVDSKSKDFRAERIKKTVKKSSLYFTRRINVGWGEYSMIRAEMILFQEAYKGEYAYYHLISGADLPIKTQDEIHAFFSKNRGKQFICCAKEDIIRQKDIHSRFRYYYFPFDKNSYLLRIQRKLGCIRPSSQITCGFGSQWVSLTHEAVGYLLSKKKWIKRTFGFSSCGDEVYKQTLLQNSQFNDSLYPDPFSTERRTSFNMREILWNEGSHPHVFTVGDYQHLIESECLFARKFDDTIDRIIIDMVFEHVYNASVQKRS